MPKSASNKSFFHEGWFYERNTQWPGQAMGLQLKGNLLYEGSSDFQDVLVFESTEHGTVLVLDGAIQCTGHDEYSYQEMITHLGMMSHPDPRRVLVIGGGDGGVLREVVKHSSVEKAVLCDIDDVVAEVSKKYLPQMSIGYKSDKVEEHIDDGLAFVRQRKNYYDVIITDSSDPEGPARQLFEKPYFQDCYDALKDGGVIVNQAENFWLNTDLIAEIKRDCKDVFPVVEWAWTSTPTYPSGSIGFIVATKDKDRDVKQPLRTLSREEEDKLFRYYNKETHAASFILPTFARKVIGSA